MISKNFMFIILMLIFDLVTTKKNIVPGLPLAIVFDEDTSNETINFVGKAINMINTNAKYGRHRWSIQISKIKV